jgi:hypothetical protein
VSYPVGVGSASARRRYGRSGHQHCFAFLGSSPFNRKEEREHDAQSNQCRNRRRNGGRDFRLQQLRQQHHRRIVGHKRQSRLAWLVVLEHRFVGLHERLRFRFRHRLGVGFGHLLEPLIERLHPG